jgi:outer membrane protein TolC
MTTRTLAIAAACLTILLVGLGIGRAAEAGDDNARLKDELMGLLKERVESAQTAMDAVQAAFDAETVTFDVLLDAMNKLVEAEVAAATTPKEEIAALQRHVDRTKQFEKKVKALFDLGTRGGEAKEYYSAKRERQSAEIALLQARLRVQR